MGIETIGEDSNFSWHIHMRCLDDGREGLKHRKRCAYRTELDVQTLVCTRGRDFPLAQISELPAMSPLRLSPRSGDVRAANELGS